MGTERNCSEKCREGVQRNAEQNSSIGSTEHIARKVAKIVFSQKV
jgi:hypothetical protein